MVIITQSKQKLFHFGRGSSNYIETIGNGEIWIRGEGIQGCLGKYESKERAAGILEEIVTSYYIYRMPEM